MIGEARGTHVANETGSVSQGQQTNGCESIEHLRQAKRIFSGQMAPMNGRKLAYRTLPAYEAEPRCQPGYIDRNGLFTPSYVVRREDVALELYISMRLAMGCIS
jgi:hypothetical protein